MQVQEKVDNTFDPFFKRHGKQFIYIVNILGLIVAMPLTVLMTVLYGTRSLPGGGWEITVYFWPAFLLLILLLGVFDRYLRRYERSTYQQTSQCIVVSMVLCALIASLGFPHMPLAAHWHLPNSPWTNLMLLAPVELGLLAGLLTLRYRHKRLGKGQLA